MWTQNHALISGNAIEAILRTIAVAPIHTEGRKIIWVKIHAYKTNENNMNTTMNFKVNFEVNSM